MRHNGHGPLTLEDARTWIEETGLCLFLPRRQFSSSVAPSFVEAVAGERSGAPDQAHIALAEELLVRLEADDVAVRLNLQGQQGEQPDYVVASWVLPYVYALRGDRDWRRSPQLTGSRQVSPLAVQAYKLLEAGEATVGGLKHALGREVTEAAVLRAIVELWQQLRIIPSLSSARQPAKWQILRHRYQKAIAEGASTSQVTAISVLASIYLQAVIAASMEEVELFLAPLTARSKVREVLRGLVATRQIHTLSVGHAPHFYVAGTLPATAPAPTLYASSAMSSSSYFLNGRDHEEDAGHSGAHGMAAAPSTPFPGADRVLESRAADRASEYVNGNGTHAPAKPAHLSGHSSTHAPRTPAAKKPTANGKVPGARPFFSRQGAPARSRKPGQAPAPGRPQRRSAAAARSSNARLGGARSMSARGAQARSGAGGTQQAPAGRGLGARRWNANGGVNGDRPLSASGSASAARSKGTQSRTASAGKRGTAPGGKNRTPNSAPSRAAKHAEWGRNGRSNGANAGGNPATKAGRAQSLKRSDARADRRKPALTANAKAGNSKRYGFTAPKREPKKRG